jgi:alkylated DNA repair dioxygenase AlkB
MWMYKGTVDVPRLLFRFEVGSELPEHVEDLRRRVEAFLRVRFSSVSFNYYRNERDSVSWHNDHTNELIERPTIALLSLGATRPMLIRSKARPRTQFRVELEPGSLMVMGGDSQLHWEHHIPKLKEPTPPRISIAFRQRRIP